MKRSPAAVRQKS